MRDDQPFIHPGGSVHDLRPVPRFDPATLAYDRAYSEGREDGRAEAEEVYELLRAASSEDDPIRERQLIEAAFDAVSKCDEGRRVP